MAKGLSEIPVQDRLIVALDLPEPDAIDLAGKLLPSVKTFKVGLQLIVSSGGLGIVERLGQLGARIFLDLKMFDIPETVVRALNEIQDRHQHIVFTTIHAFNRGLEGALKFRGASSGLKVLAVTLLTSMDDSDLADIGIEKNVMDFVMGQAKRADDAGCDGLIASGLEAGFIRKEFEHMLIVTPGIRPAWSHVPNDDQKRVTTPRDAIINGADYIVMGRPIYRNPLGDDPREAVRRTLDEIAAAVEERDALSASAAG